MPCRIGSGFLATSLVFSFPAFQNKPQIPLGCSGSRRPPCHVLDPVVGIIFLQRHGSNLECRCTAGKPPPFPWDLLELFFTFSSAPWDIGKGYPNPFSIPPRLQSLWITGSSPWMWEQDRSDGSGSRICSRCFPSAFLCIPGMDQTPDKTGKVMPAPTCASGKQFRPGSAAGNLGWGGRDPSHLQGGILHIPPMEFPKGHHRGIQSPVPGEKSSIHGSFGLELNSWC